MDAKPIGWNIVVAGRWNRAIFTPEWIATHLFQVEKTEMLQVEVALDELLPHRVTLQSLTVVVPAGRLIVEPRTMSFDVLDDARGLARLAIQKLDQTPLVAVGCNIRYEIDSLSEEAGSNLALCGDHLFADAGQAIVGRTLKRTLTFGNGMLNLDVTTPPEGATELEFNFHLKSNDAAELCAWLSVPVDDMKSTISKITKRLFGADFTDQGHNLDE